MFDLKGFFTSRFLAVGAEGAFGSGTGQVWDWSGLGLDLDWCGLVRTGLVWDWSGLVWSGLCPCRLQLTWTDSMSAVSSCPLETQTMGTDGALRLSGDVHTLSPPPEPVLELQRQPGFTCADCFDRGGLCSCVLV